MSKIKVLYIVNSLSRGSGVMSFVMNLCRNIDKSQIQIDFIMNTISEPSYKEELENLGYNIFYISVPKIINYKNYKTFKLNIYNFFNQYGKNYDIIHSHVPTFNLFYFPIARNCGIKYRIVHSHSTKSSAKLAGRIRNSFLLLNVRKTANLYIACSKEAGIYLFGRKNYNDGNVKIINNGIDTQKFKFDINKRRESRKELNTHNKFVIGHIGRFSKEKNHEFILDVFYEISKVKENAILVLVGDGELYNQIRSKAVDLELDDKIRFLGIRNDIDNLLQGFDVFLLPSKFEGLGIVAIEAQAAGLPCFLSDMIPEEVNITDLTNNISLKEDATLWSNRICNYNFNAIKREKYYKIVKNTKYDIAETTNELLDFYDGLIEKND